MSIKRNKIKKKTIANRTFALFFQTKKANHQYNNQQQSKKKRAIIVISQTSIVNCFPNLIVIKVWMKTLVS